MCQVCDKVNKKIIKDKLSVKYYKIFLDQIAKEIKGGAQAAHFDEVLDKILNTAMPESDEELDGVWEQNRKS